MAQIQRLTALHGEGSAVSGSGTVVLLCHALRQLVVPRARRICEVFQHAVAVRIQSPLVFGGLRVWQAILRRIIQQPLVQKEDLMRLQCPFALLIQALEEHLTITWKAVVPARCFELLEMQGTRAIRIQHLKGGTNAPKLLVCPFLELDQAVIGILINLLQRDGSTKICVQGQPHAGEVAMEAHQLRGLLEFMPVAAVGAIFVHGKTPGLQDVAVARHQLFLKGCSCCRIRSAGEKSWRSPYIQEGEITVANIFLVLPVQHVDQLLGFFCIAMMLQLLLKLCM
mmetsp:Transcript_76351/g.168667  ORF Transcript_76351/g.168667 Transcript_76351/m.168667 type:complete len:283 (+) Transcript_76351:317-1165(+)